MRILVTGAGGQLGHELGPALADHEVTLHDRASLDITDPAAVRVAAEETRPEVIVNAAAWTAVDDCESDPDRALLVNGTAVEHLVAAAAAVGARVVQISTDYVFDGTLDRPYRETDRTGPRSAYGRSKLAGERATRAEDTVIRTSWVCGFHGPNMVKTILRLAESHPTLRFVDDQVGHPTFADDLATMTKTVIGRGLRGTVHVTNQGAVSWFEFARAVLAAAGHDPERVGPIATEDLDPPRPAPRPANSVLDNAVLREAGIPLLDHFEVPLARLVQRLEGASR